MGIKRIIDTTFWTDEKVMSLFSPEDKLFYLYLMTNPHTTQLGVYRIINKQMAFEVGYSSEVIEVLIDRFETKYGMIRYNRKTCEIAIRNYLRYSIVKGGKPVLDLLLREAKEVKDQSLVKYVMDGAKRSDNSTVQDFISQYIFNDNDNDNDNDDSYHESYHESYHDSSKPALEKEKRHKYGQYSNVLLSDSDYAKLRNEFPRDFQERIENLSAYMKSTGKSYKDHLATIRNWARRDKKDEPVKSYQVSDVSDKLVSQFMSLEV